MNKHETYNKWEALTALRTNTANTHFIISYSTKLKLNTLRFTGTNVVLHHEGIEKLLESTISYITDNRVHLSQDDKTKRRIKDSNITYTLKHE